MSDNQSKLFRYASQMAAEAVALDKARKYKEAARKYTRAAEVLLEYIKFNKNQNLNQTYQEKVKEYIARADKLNKKMQKRLKVGGSSHKKQSNKSGDDEDYDEDEELSEEEIELRKSIEGTVLLEKPDVCWADIAGLPEPKQALREAVVLPITHKELFQGARKPWTGILLFGPPGTGKTMLAKAAANEIDCTFMVADSASMTSKWMGESEKLARTLFEYARKTAPTLIFFDEIDSLATKRGSGNESAGIRRLKTQLLQEIQGVKGKGDKLVTIMAATNRPWDIDSAFLRRLERKIYVPLPDFESRSAILRYHSRGVDIEDDVDFDKLSEMTEGYSGSDIATLCREAIMRPIRDLDKSGQLSSKQKLKVRHVNISDYTESLKKIRPTVSEKEQKLFQDWMEEFGG